MENDNKAEDVDEIKHENTEEELDTSKQVGELADDAEVISDVEFNNDPEVDKVVDEIINEESDELLNTRDEKQKNRLETSEKKTFRQKIRFLVHAWWNNKKARYATLASTGVILILAFFVPYTRYGILNLFGVRVSSSMTVLDSGTGLPLKNITVALQGKQEKTDDEGKVTFKRLKQGRSLLAINKRGFASLEKYVTLGWGSNPLGDQQIIATGSRYNFVLKDWLSSRTIMAGEASSGEDNAKSDNDGRISLIISEENPESEVIVSAEGYRNEVFKLEELENSERTVNMVPSKKHVFVSNRNGEYDLYKIDVDGKNEEVLLKSTGKEREVPYVSTHPTRDVVAFVSSREGKTNSSGFILDGLYLVNALTGESYEITRSEQIQIIGWSGNKLVFVSVVEGVSAGNSQRSKLTVFDIDTKERLDVASSNYFNDVKLFNDTIYYAISSYAVPKSQVKLYSSSVDGKTKKTLIEEQVWTVIRKDYSTLLFSTESQKWYQKNIDNEEVNLVEGQPVARKSINYIDESSKEKSAWVDSRDGKGVLILHSNKDNVDETLLTLPGLSEALYWVNDETIVYKILTTQESADYVFNINSEQGPKKITDSIGNQSQYFY